MAFKMDLQENFLESGYGSNKSNSASKRSFGSSKESSSFSSEGEYNVLQSVLKRNWKSQLDESATKHGKVTFWANSCFKDDSNEASKEKTNPQNQITREKYEKPHQMSFDSTSNSTDVDGRLNEIRVAALSQAIKCLTNEVELLPEISRKPQVIKTNSKWAAYFQLDLGTEKPTETVNFEDGFSTVVSLAEGRVIYITPSVANTLGFTEEMWVGRSFIDFLHPKDRLTFAAFITKTHLGFPFDAENGNGSSESVYCRLRQYKSFKTASGFYLIDKPAVYFPFRLTMKLDVDCLRTESLRGELFKEGEERMSEANNPIPPNHFNLIISATKIYSAYQYPEEVPINPKIFVTRHLANCQMSQVDEAGISYLGHLPQDMIGNSVLDYYHPEDMAYLEEIYKELVKEDGKPFKSKPYRFRVSNGTFALLETNWSCFINPFSWEVETVIGQHRVIQGPSNPNVFMSMEESEIRDMIEISQPSPSRRNEKQNEIKLIMILSKKIRRSNKKKILKRKRQRKNIATLVETLLEQINKNSDSENSEERSDFKSDRDSMMLGAISPHHVDQGSSESTETPPSYNQLNYRENIERFFLSQPKTSRSEKSQESQTNPNSSSLNSTDEEEKSFYFSHSNESGGSEKDDHFPSGLSENLINRHNETMEKLMVHKLKSREQRTKNSLLHQNKDIKNSWSEIDLEDNLNEIPQGTKRAWTNSQRSFSILKHPHLEENVEGVDHVTKLSKEELNLSPFSINLTPVISQPEWRNNDPRISIDGFMPVRVRTEDTWTSGVNPSIIEQVASSRQNQFVYFPTQPSLQRSSGIIGSEAVSTNSPVHLQYVSFQETQNWNKGGMGMKQRYGTANQHHLVPRVFAPRTPNSVILKPIRPTLNFGSKHCYLGLNKPISRENPKGSLSIKLSPPLFNIGESKSEMILQKSKDESFHHNEFNSSLLHQSLQNGYYQAGEIKPAENDQYVNNPLSEVANEQLCQLYHEMEIDIYEMERASQGSRC